MALWHRMRADPPRAGAAFARGLREARALHSAERRFVADHLAALVRGGRGLAAAAGTDDPDAVWLAGLVWAGLPPEAVAERDLSGLRAAMDALGATPEGRLRFHHGWPDAFAARRVEELGVDEALAFASASDARAPLDLRVNRSRGSDAAAVAALAADGVRVEGVRPGVLRVVEGRGVEASAAYRDGRVEVQDAGSQALGDLADAAPTTVLDLCAGAGGKSLQLADRGHRVVAVDPRPRALDELAKRAARSGLRIERHVGADGEVAALRGRTFGVVLVDAPCSGTGTWRRQPTLRWTWSPELESAMAERQARLLARAAGYVAPGGRLVYGTCAVGRAEDEDVADAFSAAHPGFAPGAAWRTWPHRDGTDGFFGAAWTRG